MFILFMKINHLAKELIDLRPDWFSTDFKNNKDAVKKLFVTSPYMRNQIAGCITRIKKREGQKPGLSIEHRGEEPRQPRLPRR